MNESKVEFAWAGRSFSASVFEPEDAAARRHAGVLVFHGGAGPGRHERERAERLTELGYVAFVPDLFGEVFDQRTRRGSHWRSRGLVTRAPAETNAVRASLLVCTGVADPFVTRQHLPIVERAAPFRTSMRKLWKLHDFTGAALVVSACGEGFAESEWPEVTASSAPWQTERSTMPEATPGAR